MPSPEDLRMMATDYRQRAAERREEAELAAAFGDLSIYVDRLDLAAKCERWADRLEGMH